MAFLLLYFLYAFELCCKKNLTYYNSFSTVALFLSALVFLFFFVLILLVLLLLLLLLLLLFYLFVYLFIYLFLFLFICLFIFVYFCIIIPYTPVSTTHNLFLSIAGC